MDSTFFIVLIFLAVFTAAEGIFLFFSGHQDSKRRSSAKKRMDQLSHHIQSLSTEAHEASLLREDKSSHSFTEQLYALVPGKRWLELTLYRADIATPPTQFILFSILIGLMGYLVGSIVFTNFALGIAMSLLGLIPILAARRKGTKRRQQFETQFPQALELVTRALRAGHSILFGFQLVGEEMGDPLAAEFTHLAEEIKLGKDIGDALGNLAYRTDISDIAFFNTAVMIQRETGGNLAELLDNLGYVIRDRFKLFAKVRSLTAVGKATANILGLFPLFMVGMLSLLGAEFIKVLWETPQGRMMAAAAAVLVIVGYVLCLRTARIEV
jgi:tight adherence protein B